MQMRKDKILLQNHIPHQTLMSDYTAGASKIFLWFLKSAQLILKGPAFKIKDLIIKQRLLF